MRAQKQKSLLAEGLGSLWKRKHLSWSWRPWVWIGGPRVPSMSSASILGSPSHHKSLLVSPAGYCAPNKYSTFESMEEQVNGGEAE